MSSPCTGPGVDGAPLPRIIVADAAAGAGAWPVVVGVPFPPGELRESDALAAGPDVPLTWRPLHRWRDGSVRWALVSLLAPRPGELPLQRGSAPPRVEHPVTVTREAGVCRISNGQVQVELVEQGLGPIRSLRAHGRDWLDDPRQFRWCVDQSDSAQAPSPRRTTVLEHNDLRVRVRVEGRHADASGQPGLDYRLDLELWAGRPVLRCDYTFLHRLPGKLSLPVNRIGADMKWNLGPGPVEHHLLQSVWGLYYEPREVRHDRAMAIVSDDTRNRAHVEDPAMMADDYAYPPYLRPPLVDAAPWLGLCGSQGSVYAHIDDFEAMRPKRIAVDGDQLQLDVWPARAGTLDLMQGRSRRTSVTLAFLPAGQRIDAAQAQRMLLSPLAEGRAFCSPEWYAHAQALEAHVNLPTGEHRRFEAFLRRLTDIPMVSDIFDLGDTVDDHYTRGYGLLGGNICPRNPAAPDLRPMMQARPHGTLHKYQPTWIFEPIWTNNEYDLVHALADELARSGRHALLQTLLWTARHNIEVDFVWHSDFEWKHRTTPAHCAFHTSGGSYPSHFWSQGLLEYHCMTGDPDALEVAIALGEATAKFMRDPGQRRIIWGFNREVGWSVLTLACLVDLLGDQGAGAAAPVLHEMADFLIAFDRKGKNKPVNLSATDPLRDFERQLVDNCFGYASMIEGMDRYATLSGRADAAAWVAQLTATMCRISDEAQREGLGPDARAMLPHVMAIGYERNGGDERFLDVGLRCLEAFLESPAFAKASGEAKETAMLYRSLTRFLGHAQRAGRLDGYDYLARQTSGA